MAARRASVTQSEMDNAAKIAAAHGVSVTFETPDGTRVTITPGGTASGLNEIDKMLGIAR